MANFAILRTGKLKSAVSVKGMLKHNFRTIDTPNADEYLTDKNVHIEALSVNDGMRRYRNLLPDKVRKNAVHAIDYMITTSPDANPDDNSKAISEGYEWICEKHGKENVIMASKHKDEKTPHLHVLVMPLKDGKLNARHYIGGTKHRMTDLQDEFHDRLKSKNINLDRGIKGSRAKHQTVKDWHSKQKILEQKTAETLIDALNKAAAPRKMGILKKENPDARVSRITEQARDIVTGLVQSIDNQKKIQKDTNLRYKSDQGLAESHRNLLTSIRKGDKTKINELKSKAEANRVKFSQRRARSIDNDLGR
jgi:hypothetical protein